MKKIKVMSLETFKKEKKEELIFSYLMFLVEMYAIENVPNYFIYEEYQKYLEKVRK